MNPGVSMLSRLTRWTWFACVAVLCGCSLNAKPEKPAVMAGTQITATVEGLRVAVLSQAQNAAESIERAADTIAAQTSDPQVRVNAIQWKLVSTVDLQTASVSRDPVLSLAELILFALQSQAYLTTGEGRTLFGPQQPVAVAAVTGIRQELLRYVNSVTPAGGSERALNLLQPWADAYPIRSPYVGRETVVTDSLVNAFAGVDRSALAAVGDVELSVQILDARVAQIQATMLKEARWQAELLLADMARLPLADSLTGQMGRLTTSVERVTDVAETMPDLVDRERIAAFASVTEERIAVLKSITAEREALVAALASERAIAVEALHEERVATLRDAEISAQRLIDYTLSRKLELFVNHILLRIFLGALVLILLMLGAGLILIAFARRSRPLGST